MAGWVRIGSASAQPEHGVHRRTWHGPSALSAFGRARQPRFHRPPARSRACQTAPSRVQSIHRPSCSQNGQPETLSPSTTPGKAHRSKPFPCHYISLIQPHRDALSLPDHATFLSGSALGDADPQWMKNNRGGRWRASPTLGRFGDFLAVSRVIAGRRTTSAPSWACFGVSVEHPERWPETAQAAPAPPELLAHRLDDLPLARDHVEQPRKVPRGPLRG